MAGQWNEKLSDELKKLNTVAKPTPAQVARIAALKGIKTSSGGTVRGPTPAPVQTAAKTDFQNPNQVATLQQQENTQTFGQNLVANRPNQETTFGGREYVTNPDGSTTVKDNLSGPNAELYKAEAGVDTFGAGLARNYLGQLPTQGYNSANAEYKIPGLDSANRTRIEDATYARQTRGLEDQYGRDKGMKAQQLADQGIPIGSDLYNDQMKQLDSRYDNARTDARNASTIQGSAEEAQQFGMGMQQHTTSVGNLQGNYAFGQGLASNLLGMGQGYQQPNYIGFNPVEKQGVDYSPYMETAVGQNQFGRTLAAANAQRGGGGGGSGGGRVAGPPAVQYPSMGGVAGAGISSTPQQPARDRYGNILNAAGQGVAMSI